MKEGEKNIPIVIVGNKCDMEQQREVTALEGASLATQWGPSTRFFEVSAKMRVNVDEAFNECVRLGLKNSSNKSAEESSKKGDKKSRRKLSPKCSIL